MRLCLDDSDALDGLATVSSPDVVEADAGAEWDEGGIFFGSRLQTFLWTFQCFSWQSRLQ